MVDFLARILRNPLDIKGSLIRDLVKADEAGAVERIEKMVNWNYNQSLEEAKLVIGAALSNLASLLFAYFKGDIQHHQGWAGVALILSVITFAIGGYKIIKLRRVNNVYIYTIIFASAVKGKGGAFMDANPTLFTHNERS